MALDNIDAGFDPDELAYLALTSNPEHLVRDRLAWQLTKAGHRVAREWHRCDLAVLDENDEPVALIELKAPHTGDVVWGRKTTNLEGRLRADAAKARLLAPGAEVYVLVALTHVVDPVPPTLDAIVKYGKQRRRVADQQKAEITINGYLMRLGQTNRVRLGEGTALGLRCSIDAWLCGPVDI
jgi:hypothetical protein